MEAVRDKLMRLIFESLIKTPDGLDMQPAKHGPILNLITAAVSAKDSSQANVIYEIAGTLKQMGSYKAADSLLTMMMTTVASVRAERDMFAGARV